MSYIVIESGWMSDRYPSGHNAKVKKEFFSAVELKLDAGYSLSGGITCQPCYFEERKQYKWLQVVVK
jgi:hypothetical protein